MEALKTLPEPELRIQIWAGSCALFEGTAAQLVAEGLVPPRFEWPRDSTSRCWEANGYRHVLYRKRPKGHKGSMRSTDNWVIRIYVVGRDGAWHDQRAIDHKLQELTDEIHRRSPAGRDEQRRSWRRYAAAQEDAAFQAFKAALMPEAKRFGRKSKMREA